ncbi:inner-membrane translocator [Fictibacillus halophilus]|uniref:inner-membrane translocator n=1 Tax=Fictibacillus halophilus TaxID=1610490 RepID=UPI0036405B28
MDSVILWSYFIVILLLNYAAVKVNKSGRLKLFYSGLILMILAPVMAFITGALLLNLVADIGEGAGYGGFFFGFVTLVNGFVMLAASLFIGLKKYFKSNKQNDLQEKP